MSDKVNSFEKEDKPLNIDECIDKAGGFGKLQWLLLIYAIIARQGVSFFLFNLPFSELVPRLEWYNQQLQIYEECVVSIKMILIKIFSRKKISALEEIWLTGKKLFILNLQILTLILKRFIKFYIHES